MKNWLTLSFIVLLFNSIVAQQISLIEFAFPTENDIVVYQDVIIIDSTFKANNLYVKTKKWAAEEFNSAQDVIQMDDTKMIVIKAFVEKGHNAFVKNPKNWFTFTVEFKDGKYKYNLSDIIYEFDISHMGISQHYKEKLETWLKYSTNRNTKKREIINRELEKYALDINYEFEQIINSLKEVMVTPEKDW